MCDDFNAVLLSAEWRKIAQYEKIKKLKTPLRCLEERIAGFGQFVKQARRWMNFVLETNGTRKVISNCQP